MARVRRPEGVTHGAYRFLAEAEEVEYRRWEDGQLRRLKNGYATERYPRQLTHRCVSVGSAGECVDGRNLGMECG